jgi:5-methylcytosine-specific restriction enzyme B
MLRFEKVEFTRLFQEFVNSYPSTLEGEQHIRAYEENRRQGRQNFQTVVQVADRGEDATDLVLLKLLPHADTSGNRDRGAWVHIAPAVQGNLKVGLTRRIGHVLLRRF